MCVHAVVFAQSSIVVSRIGFVCGQINLVFVCEDARRFSITCTCNIYRGLYVRRKEAALMAAYIYVINMFLCRAKRIRMIEVFIKNWVDRRYP